MKTQEIIKDSSVYAGSAVFVGFILGVQAIIIAKFLGPEVYGTFHIYRLVLLYAAYTTFGTFWAMIRQISFYRGKKDYKRIEEIKNNTLSVNIFTSVLSGICVIIFFFFQKNIYSFPMLEIFLVSFIIVSKRIYGFFDRYFLAEKKFTLRSWINIVFSICNITLVLTVGCYYKLKGVLISMVVAYIIVIIYSIKKAHFNFKFSFEIKKNLELIKVGLPIFGNGLMAAFMVSVDRLMLIIFFTPIQLGYYGISAMIRAFLELFYTSVMMTIFPSLAEKYGETNNIKEIKNYVLKPIIVSAHLAPLFFGSMILVIPLIIKYILPKYLPGVLVVQFIIAASFFGCLQVGIVNFFIAINKISKTYFSRIVSIIFSIGIIYFTINLGLNIQGVAFCVIASNILFTTLLINCFLKEYSVGVSSRIKFLLYVYYPFLYMVILIWIVNFINFSHKNFLINDLANIFCRLIAFIILNLPLLFYINKKTNILGEIKKFVIHIINTKISNRGFITNLKVTKC